MQQQSPRLKPSTTLFDVSVLSILIYFIFKSVFDIGRSIQRSPLFDYFMRWFERCFEFVLNYRPVDMKLAVVPCSVLSVVMAKPAVLSLFLIELLFLLSPYIVSASNPDYVPFLFVQ